MDPDQMLQHLIRVYAVFSCLSVQIFGLNIVSMHKVTELLLRRPIGDNSGIFLFLFLHKNICCGYSLEVPH